MEWKKLSDEAKGIIEWVVSPFTNMVETIEIKIGSIFDRDCPKLCVDHGEPLGDVDILVTKRLYQEILEYVTNSEDMQCEQFTDGLIFRLKNGVEI